MEVITNLISNNLFPIAAFLLAGYGLKYLYDSNVEQSKQTLDTISKLAEAVNNNTIVLTKVAERIGGINE